MRKLKRDCDHTQSPKSAPGRSAPRRFWWQVDHTLAFGRPQSGGHFGLGTFPAPAEMLVRMFAAFGDSWLKAEVERRSSAAVLRLGTARLACAVSRRRLGGTAMPCL